MCRNAAWKNIPLHLKISTTGFYKLASITPTNNNLNNINLESLQKGLALVVVVDESYKYFVTNISSQLHLPLIWQGPRRNPGAHPKQTEDKGLFAITGDSSMHAIQSHLDGGRSPTQPIEDHVMSVTGDCRQPK